MSRTFTTLLAALGAAAHVVGAQEPSGGGAVAVKGVAYDSLRGRPLAGAVITVAGTDRRDTTDERGRFAFDSMAAGTLAVLVQHVSLDSIGYPALTRRFHITGDNDDLLIAIPSLRTVWGAACGGEPKRDSGLVYGTINNALTRGPVANARVELSWIEVQYDKRTGLRQRRHRVETATNDKGTYVVCGVPMPQWFTLAAHSAEGERGFMDIPPTGLRVERRNLLIAPTSADSGARSTLEGQLLDEAGYPWSEARVILDDSAETRTDGDGRFHFAQVPAGTRRVQVLSLGMLPIVTTVDVYPDAPASLDLNIRRVTTLDVVRVIGTNRGRILAEQLEERRLSGFGYTMDMVELQAHATLETALREVPGLQLIVRDGDFIPQTSDGRGGQCVASVWVDGARMAVAALNMIHPREVMAIEIFPRPSTLPLQFHGLDNQAKFCGAVVLWTKWAFGK